MVEIRFHTTLALWSVETLIEDYIWSLEEIRQDFYYMIRRLCIYYLVVAMSFRCKSSKNTCRGTSWVSSCNIGRTINFLSLTKHPHNSIVILSSKKRCSSRQSCNKTTSIVTNHIIIKIIALKYGVTSIIMGKPSFLLLEINRIPIKLVTCIRCMPLEVTIVIIQMTLSIGSPLLIEILWSKTRIITSLTIREAL